MKRFLIFIFMLTLLASSAFAASSPRAAAATAHEGNIFIFATGGTIAGSAATATDTLGYQSATAPVEALIANVPEISQVANVKGSEQIAQIGSQDMTDDVWLRLAERVNAVLAQRDIDGVVITHGTDTMEETSYFLNLVVKSQKPVVLVGAARPGTAMSADGPLNIYNAAAVAAHPDSRGRGVLVVLNDTIHGAREVSKTNTFLVNTFTNLDFGSIGYVVGGVPRFYRASTRINTTQSDLDVSRAQALPRVDIVFGHAGTNAGDAVEAFVKAGAKGIIHAGVGNGSVHRDVLPSLKAAREAGVVVVRASNVGSGIVTRNGEISDDEHDFVAADSLNPKKARVLLKLVLLRNPNASTAQIQQYFNTY